MNGITKFPLVVLAVIGATACGPEAKPWSSFTMTRDDAAGHPASTTIAAVSRIPDSMEVFWIGPDGSVNDTHWYEGHPWESFVLAPGGSAEPRAGITAVSRRPNTIEVFWTGMDRSIQDAHWYEGSPWQRYTLEPPGSTSSGAGIAAISAQPDRLDLFWVTANGTLRNSRWEQSSGGWSRQDIASGLDGTSAVAAVSRGGKPEVFYHRSETSYVNTTCPRTKTEIDSNGQATTKLVYEPCVQPYIRHYLMTARGEATGSSFQLNQLGDVGGALISAPRTDISAVSRSPETVEVFYITSAGAVWDTHWYESDPQWKSFALAGDGGASPAGGITAVSRRRETWEVLWVGGDGSIQNKHWYEGTSIQGFELAPPDSAAKNGDIAMISRIRPSLESFWVTKDGALRDSHWYE